MNKDDVGWFNDTYPDGSLSAVLNMLFEKFRGLHETTPTELAELAAQALKEEIHSS